MLDGAAGSCFHAVLKFFRHRVWLSFMMSSRNLPNILITGTPGTGKTSLCQAIAAKVPDYRYINISEFAKSHGFVSEYDQELECHVLDEDNLVEQLRPIMVSGAVLLDYHGSELFPEEWLQRIYVLRTSNTVLYDRLSKRGYNEVKLRNNLEAEIFQTILDECREYFSAAIVYELNSNEPSDLERNCEIVVDFVKTKLTIDDDS